MAFLSLSSITCQQVADALRDFVAKPLSYIPVTSFAGLCDNAEQVHQNFLFVAVVGNKYNGHAFIEEAIQNGATGVIVSDKDWHDRLVERKIFVCLVGDTKRALSRIAYLFSGQAADRLSIIGVTGTNGKTTTHWMIDSLLKILGHRTARMGTIGAKIGDKDLSSNLTTPDPISLHNFFAECVKENVAFVSMEVSSHALQQHRVEDVPFSVAVFTNLSRDHLDYHSDMDQYAAAKASLFRLLKPNSAGNKEAIINLDNEWSSFMQGEALQQGCRITGYSGQNPEADLYYSDLQASSRGSEFTLTQHCDKKAKSKCEVHSDFIGNYNIENLLAAVAAVLRAGCDVTETVSALSTITQVPGRLERCSPPGKSSIFVDYAHTPDALASALKAVRPLCQKKLWAVFGCGGDRDRGKRPLMLAAAMEYADCVMVTSDNPRTEDPQRIIDDILNHQTDVTTESAGRIFVEIDRAKAIRQVLSDARADDIVLIAGKGHEDYQIIGTQKVYFSDQKIVREFYQA